MAEKIKPSEQSIVPTNLAQIEQAIRQDELRMIREIKTAILDTNGNKAAERRVYAIALQTLSSLFIEGSISKRDFHIRLKKILNLDFNLVTEDGMVTQTPPKRGEKDRPQARHATIAGTIQADIKSNPESWQRTLETFPTKQMIALGRLDLESCKPDRMGQYIAEALYDLDLPAPTANEAFTADISDILYLIGMTLQRDEELDSEVDYRQDTLDELEEKNPAMYVKLQRLARSTRNETLYEFLDLDDDY